MTFNLTLRLSELGGRERGTLEGTTHPGCQTFKGCQVETTALLPMSSP